MSELAPGAPAPAATLPALGGGKIEVPGSAPLTLVTIYKASCPTCRWALPFVQSLHEKTAGSLEVLGVASDEEDVVRDFAEACGLTFPIGIESEPWPTSTAYGLTTVPTLFLVDEGVIRLTSTGFSSNDLREVARRAAERAGGDPVDPFPEGMEVPAFRPG